MVGRDLALLYDRVSSAVAARDEDRRLDSAGGHELDGGGARLRGLVRVEGDDPVVRHVIGRAFLLGRVAPKPGYRVRDADSERKRRHRGARARSQAGCTSGGARYTLPQLSASPQDYALR